MARVVCEIVPAAPLPPKYTGSQRIESAPTCDHPPVEPTPSSPQPTASATLLRRKPSLKFEPITETASSFLAEECGWQVGLEKFLWDGEVPSSAVVTTARGFLGKGAVGIVEEVKAAGFDKIIARKRIILSRTRKSATQDRKDIQSEVENLRRLDHRHIIKTLGCYEEQYGRAPSICVLMFPVGD